MSLVGKKAPLIVNPVINNTEKDVEDFSLKNIIGKKDIILFFYPGDYTYAIPPEILLFQKLFSEFERRNVAIIGVATDSKTSQFLRLSRHKEQQQLAGIPFPLLRDLGDINTANYGLRDGGWHYDEEGHLLFDRTPMEYRGTFLIDKKGIVRHEIINFFPSIRNIYNILHVIDAWKFADEHDEKFPPSYKERRNAIRIKGDSDS